MINCPLTTRTPFVYGLAAVSMMALLSCSREQTQTDKGLSERERDSTIAKSDLPGAGVVGKALEVADSTAARVKSGEEGP